MSIISNTVNYLDGDTTLEGFFAYDDRIEGSRPTIIICHAWGGREGFVEDKTRQMAEMGYLGFALDMYGHGQCGNTKEENALLMQPFIEDRALLERRVLSALSAVKQLPWTNEAKIAAIGFCFGGLCALDLARSGADICGVISFHGLLFPAATTPLPEIKAKLLVLHGHDDPMVSVDMVNSFQNEISQANADWQFHTFGQTMHAFTNPKANDPDFGTVFHSTSNQRAWKLMKNFLLEIFE